MALAALVFAGRRQIETACAPFLFFSDPVAHGDFLYVLGGDPDVRALFAAQLWKQGLAPRIVLARERDKPRTDHNLTDELAQDLCKLGVPADRITQFRPERGVSSTADEARALELYLHQSRANRVLVVTSSFHGRRARMTFRRALAGTGVAVSVVTTDSRLVSRQHWQESDVGRTTIELECVKLIYYFLAFHS